MGEDRCAHEGLLGVGGDVDQFGDVVGHRGEQGQPVGRDGRYPQLQRQVRHHGGQVGIARPLAVAVHAALHVGGPHRHTGQGVGHGAAAVVVEVHPDLGFEPVQHGGDDPFDFVGQGAPVGVAQDQGLGPRFFCGLEDPHGELRIGPVAVEEVLGVEEDPQVVGPQEGHRIGHHGDRLVEGRAQGVDHMHLRRLGDDADSRGLRLHEMAEGLVVLGPYASAPGGSESHQRGPGEVQLLRGAGEELDVLGIGAGPAALDEGHAEVVELFGHPEFVVHRQRQALLLRAVAQGGVEDVHCVGQVG